MLKVPLQGDGFFLEAHVKLRPVDFSSEGIFLCGGAHYPKSIDESISQAYAAAGRAAAILAKPASKPAAWWPRSTRTNAPPVSPACASAPTRCPPSTRSPRRP